MVGLIGTPRQENVQLNITGTGKGSVGGRQLTAAAGDIIDFAPDASTACRIKVLSFDILIASGQGECVMCGGEELGQGADFCGHEFSAQRRCTRNVRPCFR